MVLLVLVLHYILPMSAQHARKETVTDSLNLYTLYKKHTTYGLVAVKYKKIYILKCKFFLLKIA